VITTFKDIDLLSPSDFEVFVKNVFEAAGCVSSPSKETFQN
jgi:hypothetical protein